MKTFVFICIVWMAVLFVVAPVLGAFPPPAADFSANETLVCIYDVIQFTDTSVYYGSPTWWWLFGDSQDSHEENPTHYYDTVGTYMVQLWVHDAWGEDWENKTAYITVRDCYSADFTANSTCSIGKPKVVTFNETGTPCVFDGDPGKSGWEISSYTDWMYWNGTDWVVDANGIFDGSDSHDNNAIINFTEYGTYTVTHTCMFPPPIGSGSTTKTDYIIVGVNGTYCSGGVACSGGGMVQTDWLPVAVVLAFVPIWFLIMFVSNKR
jgi:PKD repeat protein